MQGQATYNQAMHTSHVQRISLRLYSFVLYFASALLRFAQVAYE